MVAFENVALWLFFGGLFGCGAGFLMHGIAALLRAGAAILRAAKSIRWAKSDDLRIERLRGRWEAMKDIRRMTRGMNEPLNMAMAIDAQAFGAEKRYRDAGGVVDGQS